tara:strand:- start:1864 stop:2241 length:378 start_codon:yes stop_codon:yes gene_type:complete
MKLYNIAESLILEVANRSDIMDIMQQRRIAELYYDDGEDPGGKGRRWVQMYAYGNSLAGNDIVRVYQVGGDTKTIEPGWKLFRVDRMNSLRKLSGTFDEAKPLFNPTGDKDMINIYYITQFNNIT